MSEAYVTVTAKLLAKRPKAVLLKTEDAQAWIARSCIHGADESQIDDTDVGDEITLRMFDWVANKEF